MSGDIGMLCARREERFWRRRWRRVATEADGLMGGRTPNMKIIADSPEMEKVSEGDELIIAEMVEI